MIEYIGMLAFGLFLFAGVTWPLWAQMVFGKEDPHAMTKTTVILLGLATVALAAYYTVN